MQTPGRHLSRRATLAVTTAAAAGVALDACSSSGSPPRGHDPATIAAVSQAEIDKAMKTPTTLTFWTRVPDIATGGDLRAAVPGHQDQRRQSRPGHAAGHQAAHALDAGKGTPELSQVEYQ